MCVCVCVCVCVCNTLAGAQVKELADKGLVEESDGARVIHCGRAFPLMAVKSDGGCARRGYTLALL